MCTMSEQIVNANGAAFHVTEGGVPDQPSSCISGATRHGAGAQ